MIDFKSGMTAVDLFKTKNDNAGENQKFALASLHDACKQFLECEEKDKEGFVRYIERCLKMFRGSHE